MAWQTPPLRIVSAWAKDLHEGDSHRGVMNYNFRLTFAKDPAKRVSIPAPQHYDRARYRLLENWLREKAARKQAVKLAYLLDFYARRNGKFEVNNKQAAIISLGHFGGQFDYPDADYATRERIVADLGITRTKPAGHVFSTVYRGLQTDFFTVPARYLDSTANFMSFTSRV